MLSRAAAAGALAALLFCNNSSALAQAPLHWGGFYAGVHGGFARGSAGFSASDLAGAGFTNPLSISGLDGNGSAFGFGGGFNAQAGLLVLGIEGDWSLASIRAGVPFAANIPPFGAVSGTLGTELDWMATIRLRAGLALGRALLYGTAGLAVARATGELTVLGGGGSFNWTDSALLAGWTWGAGVEYALSPSWSVKAEFTHTPLGDSLFSSASGSVPLSSRLDVYNVRGGLNFRF